MSASINSGVAPNWSWARPMRNAPPLLTRPPDLGNAPAVSDVFGFGIGSGAGIGANSDLAWGHVRVFVGVGGSNGGEIELLYPSPQTMTYMADWAIVIAVVDNGTTVHHVVLDAVDAPLVQNSKPLILAYERTVSV